MRRSTIILGLALVLIQVPAFAGVVFELDIKDHGTSPPTSQKGTVSIEGQRLKVEGELMDQGGSDTTMLYLGDRKEMMVVNHSDKTYMVIDEASIAQVSSQISDAMKQVEDMLKDLPEDQRAMAEKMMKQQMPQSATPSPMKPADLRKVGSDKINGFSCTRYDVYEEGAKTAELCAAAWKDIEGGDEALGMVKEMAGFFEQMMTSLKTSLGPLGGPLDFGVNPFEVVNRIDGFPVMTRNFEGERLEHEAMLSSSKRMKLDPADFEPPAGYKRQTMTVR